MQRAARRQLHFHRQYRIFLMNATFPQPLRALSDDHHRHQLHGLLQKLFSASRPSRLTVLQSCLHLSLLIRCFSSGSPSPSLGFPSSNQSNTVRNAIEVTEDECSQALDMNASVPFFDNTEVSGGLNRNQKERPDDVMLIETGKVDDPLVLLSDASRQRDTEQVSPHRLCMDPHCVQSFQGSQGSEFSTLPSEVAAQLHCNEGTRAIDCAVSGSLEGATTCDFSSPFDPLSQARNDESFKDKDEIDCAVSGSLGDAAICDFSSPFDTLSQVRNDDFSKDEDDLASGLYSYTGNIVKSSLWGHCTRESNEENFGASSEVSILLLLEKHGWGQHTEDALHSFTGNLTPEIVAKIVDELRDARVAFSFLQWAGREENFQHREEYFTKVVGRLGKDKEFEMGWTVLEYMKQHGLKVDYAFSIFIHRLKSANMADSVAKAMDSMSNLNVMPTVALYTLALQVMLKTNNLEIAQRLYNQMRQAGLQPDAKFFGTLIAGFGKAGMVNDALFFFEQMQRDGVHPDSFAYTRLIRAFSVAGRYVEGQRLYTEMVHNDCLPTALSRADLECALYGVSCMEEIKTFLANLENRGHLITVHTYNNIIQYLLENKMLLEAAELFRRLLDLGDPLECDSQPSMDKRATMPNKKSYSLLICGLCKGDKLTEAFLLFKEMLAKGLNTTSDLCNCLLHGFSSKEGFMYEAVELASHIARENLIVDVETQKIFFRALKAGGDLSKALQIFDTMKCRGCIDSSSSFYTLSNVEG